MVRVCRVRGAAGEEEGRLNLKTAFASLPPPVSPTLARVEASPSRYFSPNASPIRDVLGTLMLGILAGSTCFAHIVGVRGDTVAARSLREP